MKPKPPASETAAANSEPAVPPPIGALKIGCSMPSRSQIRVCSMVLLLFVSLIRNFLTRSDIPLHLVVVSILITNASVPGVKYSLALQQFIHQYVDEMPLRG